MPLPYETERVRHTKRQAKTNPKYGCLPSQRETAELIKYGVINVDKPVGPTSHQVSAYVQQILGLQKAGHAGTLDPKVSGVLPVALGTGTRVVQALLNQGKEYVCIMHLHTAIDESVIRKSTEKFLGKIMQLPPIKSAVKRQWRERTVYYLDILEIKDQDVLFRIGCQAGTYIRKICSDWGKMLGTNGHMAELRRTKAAGFTEDNCVTLLDVQDAMWYYTEEHIDTYLRHIIAPLERAVMHVPKVWILDSAIESVCHGSNVSVPGISALHDCSFGEIVAIMSLKDELIALGETVMKSEEVLERQKGIAVKTQKVFMKPGTYPGYKNG